MRDMGELEIINDRCPYCIETTSRRFGMNRNGTQRYQCTECLHTYTENTGTIMQNTSLTIDKLYCIIFGFLEGYSVSQTQMFLSLNSRFFRNLPAIRTLQKYYNQIRDIILLIVMNMINEIYLEGEVEIDEALIFRKKHRGGRLIAINYWVFGMRERNSNKRLVFPVPNRTRVELFSIIRG